MPDLFARSYERLATPYCTYQMGNHLDVFASVCRLHFPTQIVLVPAWPAYPSVLTYPNSSDCRPNIGRLSPVFVGGNWGPSPVFTAASQTRKRSAVLLRPFKH